jgi:hypothetical protein
MCIKLKTERLIEIADEMASAAASIATSQQSYHQFIACRERLQKEMHALDTCEHK